MKTKLLKFYSGILSSLLVLLGFASCGSDDDGEQIYMYGVISATYKVKGSIVSEKTKDPVEGIQVVLVPTYNGEESIWGDTILTNAKGEFNLRGPSENFSGATFNLKISDVDGEANGSFDPEVKAVKIDNPQGKWETEKDLGEIEISPSKK